MPVEAGRAGALGAVAVLLDVLGDVGHRHHVRARAGQRRAEHPAGRLRDAADHGELAGHDGAGPVQPVRELLDPLDVVGLAVVAERLGAVAAGLEAGDDRGCAPRPRTPSIHDAPS
ncbi:hypothetical protein, partial [Pimelobacter simplex]|uniref:hypothetical protein n=1 Tax=Nocardioides simplex TaxID=2045 RepID=UPI001C2046EC